LWDEISVDHECASGVPSTFACWLALRTDAASVGWVRQGDDLAVLRRGLDQLTDLFRAVDVEVRDHSTPCQQWTVQNLVDHVVAMPTKFARMVRDEPIDWSAPTPPAGDDPAQAFRSNADELLRAWHGRRQDSPGNAALEWQCAELAAHTWDLATALSRQTGELDPEVAERGLAFMHANLTEDNRSPAFGPEQHAPEGADAYQRIASFAGRSS
jgi:uncharacterized protein (TIGR03086 family)